MTSPNDRQLGLDRDITRRDFLNGVTITAAGSMMSAPLTQAVTDTKSSFVDQSAQMEPGYYPPHRDGMRGSHPGSFEVAHQMRFEGKRWDDPSDSVDSNQLRLH